MTWPGPSFQQWADRLPTLECGDGRCPCHHTTRVGHGLTHCPAHLDRHPSLSLTEALDGKRLWHCLTGCDQTALTKALFGDVIVEWSRAEWESQRAASAQPNYRDMTAAQLRDIAEHLDVALHDDERTAGELDKLLTARLAVQSELGRRARQIAQHHVHVY